MKVLGEVVNLRICGYLFRYYSINSIPRRRKKVSNKKQQNPCGKNREDVDLSCLVLHCLKAVEVKVGGGFPNRILSLDGGQEVHRLRHHPRVLTDEDFSWSETAAPMSWIPIYDNGLVSIRFLDRTDNSCQHDSTSALAVAKMKMTFLKMISRC